MSDSTVDRRKLIQGTGAAIAGSVIVGAGASSAAARHEDGHATPATGADQEAPDRGPQHGGYQFLGPGEAASIAAMADRIIPADDLGPGASEAGVIAFIDRGLAGFYSDDRQAYQRGLKALDQFSNERFENPFVKLTEEQQDEILAAMEDGTATGFDVPSAPSFFELVRRHVMEGLFADPIYGGNRDFIGWKLINFPGPVFAYSPEEMQSGVELNKPFVSLADQFPTR